MLNQHPLLKHHSIQKKPVFDVQTFDPKQHSLHQQQPSYSNGQIKKTPSTSLHTPMGTITKRNDIATEVGQSPMISCRSQMQNNVLQQLTSRISKDQRKVLEYRSYAEQSLGMVTDFQQPIYALKIPKQNSSIQKVEKDKIQLTQQTNKTSFQIWSQQLQMKSKSNHS